MTVPQGANLYTQGFGSRPEGVEIPTYQTRAPQTSDVNWPLGKTWINTATNTVYTLTSFSSMGGIVTATWTTGAGGTITTLDGSTGSATPTGGVITIAGTPNEITTAASGSTVTLSLPSSIIAPGSITATAGAITASDGDLVLTSAGSKIIIGTGSNASIGQANLISGTVTIDTTAVDAGSIIFLSRQNLGGTLGELYVGTIVVGTSFIINSTSDTESSTVNWWIVN